jgi:hypothetical protein
LRVVLAGNKGPARRTSSEDPVCLSARREVPDPSAKRGGQSLCAELEAKGATTTARLARDNRPAAHMSKTWFVPPIVVPILIGLGLAALIAVRAFQ